MKKLLLYGHGGAYNHGAEAIVRASVPMFRQMGFPIFLSTHFPEQDRAFGLDKLVDKLIPADLSLAALEKQQPHFEGKAEVAKQIYQEALALVDGETVCIGIGGDNYCYPNWHRQSIFHEAVKQCGGKSILWGCSIQPEMIDSRMEAVLRTHDRIYVRESVTARALEEHGISQAVCLPDPAFFLTPEETVLPENFGTHTAALNVSPMVLRKSEALMDCFVETAHNLLERADALLLVPHVLMPSDDDQTALNALAQRLSPQERARVCWAGGHLNAAQRKYLIAQCELLVCCRTHASIAGYSTGVPTLVLGYSVKAEGIAADLGMGHWLLSVPEGAKLPDLTTALWERRGDVRTALQARQEHMMGREKRMILYGVGSIELRKDAESLFQL